MMGQPRQQRLPAIEKGMGICVETNKVVYLLQCAYSFSKSTRKCI